MKLWTCLVAALLLTGSIFAADVPTFGPVGNQLRPSDVAALSSIARGRAVIAIEAHRDMVLPEAWLAFAYLRPDSEARGIRRGRVLDCKAVLAGGAPQRWRVTSRNGRYAQVALPGTPFTSRVDDDDLDRPFRVLGKFSDQELAEIVAYVRSSPKKPPIPDDPDGTSHVELDEVKGTLPIVQVARSDGAGVDLWLASSARSGWHVVLHRRGGAWQIGEISGYIS